MAEQGARPGMAEVTGAFGAQEIDDPGRRRVILRRPVEQSVDDHEDSLPDPRQTGAPHQPCELRRPTVDASGLADTQPTSTRTTSSPISRGTSHQRKTCLAGKASLSMSNSPQVLAASDAQ